ncbi:hypothetical protein BHM03_00030188 [Ensete ventricosum]|nr:hypothetical protein BHM03_00030188 [Ensete ventricosum]
MSSNLAIEEVICAAHIYENDDGLLLEKASRFHRLRVVVAVSELRHCYLVWVVEFYQILNANVGGSGRLIDLRLGVDVGGDVLKHLWELLGWMEATEMAAGVGGMRL